MSEHLFVIPGRRQWVRAQRGPLTTNPESSTRAPSLDSGFARRARPGMTTGLRLRRRNGQQTGNAAAADVVDPREHHVVALDLDQHRSGEAFAVELAKRH